MSEPHPARARAARARGSRRRRAAGQGTRAARFAHRRRARRGDQAAVHERARGAGPERAPARRADHGRGALRGGAHAHRLHAGEPLHPDPAPQERRFGEPRSRERGAAPEPGPARRGDGGGGRGHGGGEPRRRVAHRRGGVGGSGSDAPAGAQLSSRTATRKAILSIVATDRTFEKLEVRGAAVWQGKCIHCNSHLTIGADGEPISRATIEHILPRTHGGTNEARNLALACARCNHQKGVRLDPRRRGDPTLEAVIATLQARRLARWREPDE
ncbi:MAG: HNH endonuclease [Deltaproteobacteria bacterium]|nr:HNH endonuclease [Deltaproteobacteria bacterium]